MKKILLFLLVFYSSFNYSYAQSKNINESIQIKKELTDSLSVLKKQIISLENKLSVSELVSKNNFKVITQSLDSTKKSIDDTRLRESLKSAESTINMQNSWISGFGDIFSTITIVIAIIAVLLTGISILYFFFQVRPAVESAKHANIEAGKAIETLKYRISNFDQRIESKLDLKFIQYSEKLKNDNVDHIIEDLICPNSFLRDQAKYRISTFRRNELSEEQIYRLFDILNKYIESSVEEAIIYFLTKNEENE